MTPAPLCHAAEGGYSPKDGEEITCVSQADKMRPCENDSQSSAQRRAHIAGDLLAGGLRGGNGTCHGREGVRQAVLARV